MQELQHHMLKKAELDSECLCFDEFSERRLELAAKLQTETLPGDLQDVEYLFVAGSEFREEFLRVQPKCDLVGVQDHPYSFQNARNREDVAQCLQLVAKKKTGNENFPNVNLVLSIYQLIVYLTIPIK
jgi:hypothetical protein